MDNRKSSEQRIEFKQFVENTRPVTNYKDLLPYFL